MALCCVEGYCFHFEVKTENTSFKFMLCSNFKFVERYKKPTNRCIVIHLKQNGYKATQMRETRTDNWSLKIKKELS